MLIPIWATDRAWSGLFLSLDRLEFTKVVVRGDFLAEIVEFLPRLYCWENFQHVVVVDQCSDFALFLATHAVVSRCDHGANRHRAVGAFSILEFTDICLQRGIHHRHLVLLIIAEAHVT